MRHGIILALIAKTPNSSGRATRNKRTRNGKRTRKLHEDQENNKNNEMKKYFNLEARPVEMPLCVCMYK